MQQQQQQFGKYQLAILIIVFLIGSTPLFELGITAKQDAWIAMLVAAAAGLLLTVIYLSIHKRAPNAGLGDLYKYHFGRYIGGFVAIVHAFWLAYESMRNVRDVGELTTMALLNFTPKWIIMLLILAVAVYTASKGIEVLVRIIQLLFPVVLFSYFVVILLVFFSGLVKFNQLLPIMENGPMPILKAAFPNLLSFPFAQMVVFLVLFGHVSEKKSISKVTYWSQIGVSIFLVFMNALILCVLGPELAELTALPLLHVVQLVRLANFLERLDVVVTLLLFIGLFVKIATLYIASILMASEATGWSYRALVFPIGILIYAASFLEPNNTYHIWVGLDITLKIAPFFQVALPLAMLVMGIRKKYRGAALGGAQST
ncbi:spore gernimation protein [Paenibacillus sp. 1011MAR3C5]|uniref:GerAB/ArcD/ProY family transporter n=1 Tax=Paenibacillus sp. 1011MAR3C5 TaxID=1675787 RepID=UPI000E6D170C|nr:endospore germination permease [Paenibacillus sp. 1011MAR3C5]RJE86682.1 spore gernimation protein [Paenibacillus sp. 1011MAR3C5]